MELGLQIQGLKTFLDYMKLQVENIEMQNNTMNPLMMNQIGEQLLNISIQMLNNGIQYFTNFKYLSININQYYEKLTVISQQINNILTSQQMMQPNMLLQQQMIQDQMMEPMKIQTNNNIKRFNIIFKDTEGRSTTLVVGADTTIKELIDKYMNKAYGYEKKDLEFIFNAYRIDRNSQTKLREYFRSWLHCDTLPNITVNDVKLIP